ncbi:glutaconyl-CoA decarboxylase subunit gamma-like [Triticum urartu]|uniref:glutaconyl-CoA decarboxylase subunit gamma-like n=1 Tax=Triticum urartu TaxID=4572 RepID=UPI002043E19C|nr:glutaconyl-CoA decarboxylase subunit gamma-like [Triticum urartu]
MGVAASAAAPPPEAAAPAGPPAKEDIEHGSAASAADAPPEATAPADSPAKEEAQSAAAAASPGGEAGAAGETVVLDASAEGGEEEEEGECGFCLFMKGGGCKEEFVGWEKCVEQAEAEGGDVVERCHDATAALRRCMDKFPDYYEPILRAERAMAEDLEAFKASEASEPSPASPPPPAAEEEQGDNKKQAEPVVVKEKEDLAA